MFGFRPVFVSQDVVCSNFVADVRWVQYIELAGK